MKLKKWVEAERGRMTALANTIGVVPSLVSMWVNEDRRVPAEWCLEIERATDGQVRAEELRPDLNWTRATHKKAGAA